MALLAPSGPAPLSTVAIQGSQVPAISNISAVLANTEYSHTFTANTKKFKIRVRGLGRLQIAYSAGDSGSAYFTVYPGECYEEETLTLTSGTTIYFQTSIAAQIVEVVSWS